MDKASEPKMSTMKTEGAQSVVVMLESAERMAGLASRIITHKRVTTEALGSTRPEMFGDGISMTSTRSSVLVDLRMLVSASEVWEVMARMVTLRLW